MDVWHDGWLDERMDGYTHDRYIRAAPDYFHCDYQLQLQVCGLELALLLAQPSHLEVY